MPTASQSRTKKISILAMMCALGWLTMFLIKIPVVSFLKYEPKDIFIVLSGFLYGPLAAAAVAFATAVLELPVSTTGFIGMVMNFLSSAAFACIASLIYKRRKTLMGAVLGLVAGMAAMTVTMLLWNYLISPLYMGVTREEIVPMLTTVFLPFNLLKSGINSALTLLIYRPFVQVLQQAGFVTKGSVSKENRGSAIAASVVCVLILVVCGIVIYCLNH